MIWVLTPVIGAVAYFVSMWLWGGGPGFAGQLWLAGVPQTMPEWRAFGAWLRDLLILAVPLCAVFGVPFGYRFGTWPLLMGLLMAAGFLLASWGHYLMMALALPPLTENMIMNYIGQALLLLVLFVAAVAAGNGLARLLTGQAPQR